MSIDLDISQTIGVLIQLYVIAFTLTVVLQQLFDTDAYKAVLGKGLNGQPSRFLPGLELRPYFATAVGIFVACAAELELLSQGLGVDMASGWLGGAGPVFDWILTGILLGGGAKTVKKLAKGVAGARSEITS